MIYRVFPSSYRSVRKKRDIAIHPVESNGVRCTDLIDLRLFEATTNIFHEISTIRMTQTIYRRICVRNDLSLSLGKERYFNSE